MIDLHIHSKYSDGSYNIAEITKKAKEKDLSVISITDHDNIESIDFIINHMLKENILFVPGVELSTESFFFDEKMKVHLLGYGFDHQNEILIKALEDLYCSRALDNKKYIETLVSLFPFINLDMFDNFAYGKYGWIRKLILQHISDLLSDPDKAKLQDYLINNKPIYHSYNFQVEEAIKIINNAGGYPILAHPFQLKLVDEDFVKFIKYLKSKGLKGIETYHNDSTIEQSNFYHKLALEYELLESGGSDFHHEQLGTTYKELTKNSNELVKRLILENKILGDNNGRK